MLNPNLKTFQFLNYVQHLDFEIEYLGLTGYRKVVFKLRDFLEFQDLSVKHTKRYRLAILIAFY